MKYLPSCHSTNDFCQEILNSGTFDEGFVVHTGHQTKGRGQRGNSWNAEPNQNILMSVMLKPVFLKAADQFYLNMVVSLAVFDTLRQFLNENLKVKWPNDIYFQNQKIGGVLIENSIQGNNISCSIIGIGLNVNQLEFENAQASSLRIIIGTEISLDNILEPILEKLEYYYLKLKSGDFGFLKASYLQTLFRINQWHTFRKNGQIFLGKITGIDENGRLAMETEFGAEVFGFKEVEFVI